MLHMGEEGADATIPPLDWLDPNGVLLLSETPHKASREIGLTLIRRHYARLGGSERLGWLMESPFREVRLFAVRMLWDHHAPRPKAQASDDARFENTAALRTFLRTVMFGLPPGRMERRTLKGEVLPERALPASVAKRRLVEVVRDLSLTNGELAKVVVPILEEMMHSEAKGEWQAAVTALAQLRRAHPEVQTSLPTAIPHVRPARRSRAATGVS